MTAEESEGPSVEDLVQSIGLTLRGYALEHIERLQRMKAADAIAELVEAARQLEGDDYAGLMARDSARAQKTLERAADLALEGAIAEALDYMRTTESSLEHRAALAANRRERLVKGLRRAWSDAYRWRSRA